MPSALQTALLLVFFTFLPPLVAALLLRNAARRRSRVPWLRVFIAFLYGAVIAILAAQLLEAAALRLVAFASFAIVVAPVVEESCKGLGLFLLRDDAPKSRANGYVYGGLVGLGFAATENYAYVTGALVSAGSKDALVLGIYRGIATVALHAATSAILGRAAWRFRYGPRTPARRVRALALVALALASAVGLHAIYNLIAPRPTGPALAIVLSVGLFAYVRARVRATG